MAPEVAEVLETARALTANQRADLAYQVLLTLDDHQAGVDVARVDAAWQTEIAKRLDGYLAGTETLLDVEESHAELRSELADLGD